MIPPRLFLLPNFVLGVKTAYNAKKQRVIRQPTPRRHRGRRAAAWGAVHFEPFCPVREAAPRASAPPAPSALCAYNNDMSSRWAFAIVGGLRFTVGCGMKGGVATRKLMRVRKSPEQLRVSACPGEHNGVARKLVDQQKIAADVAFPEIGPFPRQFVVAVFGWQWAVVGDQ